MGAIAGPQLIVLMLTAMEHDLQARINIEMDKQMMLSMQSVNIGNAKASIFQQVGNLQGYTDQTQYAQAKAKYEADLQRVEAMERRVQIMEKMIDMRLKQLENQLKQVQQRKESQQKILDQNIQRSFTYGQR